MLTLDKIYHAAYVLKEVARKTDLIYAPKLVPGCDVYLKTENLQVTGSFKLRGAYYRISQLSPQEKEQGIVACSAGNHAQGVALAAQKNGIPCVICMPDNAPISKVENTKAYGAEVKLVPGAYDDAAAYAAQLQKESGYTFIHPFDDADVIAGQGTIGLEILEQLPDADVVLVPVGGGGLCSGVAYAIKHLNPACKVYGVQAAGAASMVKAIENHEIAALPAVDTFADGIAVKRPGDLTFALVNEYADGLVTVTDDEVATAILALIEQHKMICEGAGAVSVAAAMFGKVDVRGKKVCCLLSGGNIDVNILSRVISRGLLKAGRTAELTIALIDKPGQLTGVSRIISAHGGNVIGVFHDQGEADMAINSCFLKVKMETRDAAQVQEIREALKNEGFQLV